MSKLNLDKAESKFLNQTKFDGLDALKAQIAKDKEAVLRLLVQ